MQRTLFDLLGPIIDPIGYQIELETYVANIMRGPANLYITLAGYLGSALVFFHFYVDPQQALVVRLSRDVDERRGEIARKSDIKVFIDVPY